MATKIPELLLNVTQGNSSDEKYTGRANIGINLGNGSSIGDETHPMYWNGSKFATFANGILPVIESSDAISTLKADRLYLAKNPTTSKGYPSDGRMAVLTTGTSDTTVAYTCIGDNAIWHKGASSSSWSKVPLLTHDTNGTEVSKWNSALSQYGSTYSSKGVERLLIGDDNTLGMITLHTVGTDGKASKLYSIIPPSNVGSSIYVSLPATNGTLITESQVNSIVSSAFNTALPGTLNSFAVRYKYQNLEPKFPFNDEVLGEIEPRTGEYKYTVDNPYESNHNIIINDLNGNYLFTLIVSYAGFMYAWATPGGTVYVPIHNAGLYISGGADDFKYVSSNCYVHRVHMTYDESDTAHDTVLSSRDEYFYSGAYVQTKPTTGNTNVKLASFEEPLDDLSITPGHAFVGLAYGKINLELTKEDGTKKCGVVIDMAINVSRHKTDPDTAQYIGHKHSIDYLTVNVYDL